MKKFKILLVAGALFSCGSAIAGIPVTDGANIANQTANQIQSWSLEAKRWLETAQQYKQDYEAQLNQLATQTGARDIIGFMRDAQKAYSQVNDLKKWVDNPSSIYEYGLDILSGELKRVYESYGMTDLCPKKDVSETSFVAKERKRCEGEVIVIAQKQINNQRNLERVQDRVKTINEISNRMSNAKDTKEAQDLNNAMQTQIALLQADKIQMDIQNSVEFQQEKLTKQKEKDDLIKKYDSEMNKSSF